MSQLISVILSTQIFLNAGTVSKFINAPVTASEELFRVGEIQVDSYFAGVAESDGFLPGCGGGGICYASGLTGHGSGDEGGGMEYRFNRNLGLFSEARYLYSAELPRNPVIYRSGFRFVF